MRHKSILGTEDDQLRLEHPVTGLGKIDRKALRLIKASDFNDFAEELRSHRGIRVKSRLVRRWTVAHEPTENRQGSLRCGSVLGWAEFI